MMTVHHHTNFVQYLFDGYITNEKKTRLLMSQKIGPVVKIISRATYTCMGNKKKQKRRIITPFFRVMVHLFLPPFKCAWT